jgi:hypothetical protein
MRGLALLAALLLAGCAELRDAILERGSRLHKPDAALVGQAKRAALLQWLGEPDEIDQRWLGAHASEVLHFHDISPSENTPGNAEYRYLALEFSGGVLTGYAYHDSLPDNAKDIAGIKLAKGKTKRAEAQTLLGSPESMVLLPSTLNLAAMDLPSGGAPFPIANFPAETHEVWQYFTQTFDEALHVTARQTRLVFFDVRGIVIEDWLLRELLSKRR